MFLVEQVRAWEMRVTYNFFNSGYCHPLLLAHYSVVTGDRKEGCGLQRDGPQDTASQEAPHHTTQGSQHHAQCFLNSASMEVRPFSLHLTPKLFPVRTYSSPRMVSSFTRLQAYPTHLRVTSIPPRLEGQAVDGLAFRTLWGQ